LAVTTITARGGPAALVALGEGDGVTLGAAVDAFTAGEAVTAGEALAVGRVLCVSTT
jgi:hypothetical protein